MKTKLQESLHITQFITADEVNYLLSTGMTHYQIYTQVHHYMRRSIDRHMQKHDLEFNLAFKFTLDSICDIRTKTCRMELTYGPSDRLPLWKVETHIAKRKLGLII